MAIRPNLLALQPVMVHNSTLVMNLRSVLASSLQMTGEMSGCFVTFDVYVLPCVLLSVKAFLMKSIELHHLGDRELWYARSADDTWSLPMYVDWKHDRAEDKHYAMVTPAVSLYHSQILIMKALMAAHNRMEENNRWLISRRIAETILHKAPGITPALYYKWPDAACPPLPPKWGMSRFRVLQDEPKKVATAEGFIKFVSLRQKIPVDLIKTVITAVEQEAPVWMVSERQPLELGFCRLIAAPFRSNWKEIVALKARGFRLPSVFSQTNETMWKVLEYIGLPGLLCSTDNIGMKYIGGGHRLSYVIEAIPTEKFEKVVNAVEEERMSCGTSHYVSFFEETVEKLYKYLAQALGSYVKKAAMPFARVSTGGSSGIISFRPVGGRNIKIKGQSIMDLPVSIVPPVTRFTVLGTTSDLRLIQAQTETMQAVPALPSTIEDVRRSAQSGELDRLKREHGANGLHVLDAVQGKTDGPPMLPLTTDT